MAMAYFNTLRITVTKSFPNSIAAYAEAYVSCKRIETFLLYEEISKSSNSGISTKSLNGEKNGKQQNGTLKKALDNDDSGEKGDGGGDEGVFIENATARWNKVRWSV